MARSSLVILLSSIAIAFLNYAFAIGIGWVLPVDEYGVFGVAVSLLTVGAFVVSNGIPWSVTLILPTLSEEPSSRAGRLVKGAILGNALLGIAVATILLLILAVKNPFEQMGVGEQGIVAAAIVALAVNTTYKAVLHGTVRFGRLATVQTLEALLRVASGLGFALMGAGVLGALAGFLVGYLTTTAVMIVARNGLRVWGTKGWSFREVLNLAPMAFLGLMAIGLLQNIDIVVLKLLVEGSEQVSNQQAGLYQSVLVISRTPFWMATVVVIMVAPTLAGRTYTDQAVFSIKALRYVALFVLPVAFLISLLPDVFLGLLFPPEYQVAALALRLSSIAMGCLSVVYLLSTVFQAAGKPHVPGGVLLAAVVLQALLLGLLVPQYRLAGAALATMIGTLFALVILGWRYCTWYRLRLRAVDIRKAVAYGTALGMAGAAALVLPHSNTGVALASLAATGSLYMALLFILRLATTDDVKQWISAMPKTTWFPSGWTETRTKPRD